MKLKDLTAIANAAYPDGLIRCAELGDGLAKFIKMELRETYDPKASSLEQVDQAVQSLERAQKELGAVVDALAGERARIAVIQSDSGLGRLLRKLNAKG